MEFKSNTPIYLQVIEDIKSKIIVGEIKPGEKLPSSRELAVMYDINPIQRREYIQRWSAWGYLTQKGGLAHL